MKTVFIYCLKDPTTGDVRYIGQTNNLKRRFKEHCSGKQKTHLGDWLRSLSEPPVLVVLHEVAENESWQEEEQRYISCARAIRVDLVNATDGGDGASGYKYTPEARAAISAAKKGVPRGPHSPETCAAISAALTGVKLSTEHCAALSAAKKGVPKSPEHCAAISATLTGRTLTSEHRAAMRVPKSPEYCAVLSASMKGMPPSSAQRTANEARKGVPRSPETCAAMSAARMGVPWSPAQRAAHEAGKLAAQT